MLYIHTYIAGILFIFFMSFSCLDVAHVEEEGVVGTFGDVVRMEEAPVSVKEEAPVSVKEEEKSWSSWFSNSLSSFTKKVSSYFSTPELIDIFETEDNLKEVIGEVGGEENLDKLVNFLGGKRGMKVLKNELGGTYAKMKEFCDKQVGHIIYDPITPGGFTVTEKGFKGLHTVMSRGNYSVHNLGKLKEMFEKTFPEKKFSDSRFFFQRLVPGIAW